MVISEEAVIWLSQCGHLTFSMMSELILTLQICLKFYFVVIKLVEGLRIVVE